MIIMDRGYPSTPAFIHMMDKNIKFVVRLRKSDYKKEQLTLTEDDSIVEIELNKSRIRHYEGTGKNLFKDDKSAFGKRKY